ncbi:hypothetical protein Val02_71840 [Virgisporangium aliadipatigenens]|uniref:Methylamine utilisation protein MauE domain-containing protein n=1 Tax=Virgisporangium aliadipatigenens TaxID=741659 RepID=A0A8J3YTS0_9ACTN|nr:MauE/DoxX family redox-associated membrane protein [Virgisporangium aliadipatigenens]GIJ50298.1 hypothetical protein Val02_71840 [Virgisporangium aliadipatigenens]
MAYVEVAVRALVVTVFVVAVWGKAHGGEAWREFVASVRAFDVVPARAVRPVAALVAGCEAVGVALLAVPATVVAGYGLAAALLAAFAVAMAVSLRRGAQPVCRCFGGRGSAVTAVHVARNLGLVVVALLAVAARMFVDDPVEPAGAALAALSGVLVAALVVRLDDVVALFAPVSSPRSR